MKDIIIKIDGMTCKHCVANITEDVSEIDGVSAINISLEDKNASVSFDENVVNIDDIMAIIKKLGFEASI